MKPDKNKDQHIMVDSGTKEEMASAAYLTNADEVLEIGGGPGNLTEIISKRAKFVYTVEKDKRYYSLLKKKFAGIKKVKVINGNILDVELPRFDKIISNPPYKILQPFFYKLVKEGGFDFKCCVMTVPHGFAKLITKAPKNEGFGLISALFYAFYNVEVVTSIPKSAFNPEPRVTSYIVRITPKKDDSNLLRTVLKNAFLHNNMKLRNVILSALWNEGIRILNKKVTKKEARQMIEELKKESLAPILNKSIFQLSTNETSMLSRDLI